MLCQQNFIFCGGIWTLFYRLREPSEYLQQESGIVIYVIQKDRSDTVVRMIEQGGVREGFKLNAWGEKDQWYAYSPVLFSLIIHFQKVKRINNEEKLHIYQVVVNNLNFNIIFKTPKYSHKKIESYSTIIKSN